jgi:NtrC-family two-component system response regulator AlgB
VRELRSVLERAALLSDKDTLDLEHLPEVVLRGPAADGTAMLTTTMNELERDHIMHVIATTASLEEAAEKLGINPATLWRKRKRYGIG